MKKLALVLIVLFCVPVFAQAEQLRLSWGFDETVTTGTHSIYERTATGKSTVLDNIPVTDRSAEFTATLPADGSCRTYFMEYAQSPTVHGDPSLAIGWCPDGDLPDLVIKPGTIMNLTLEVIQGN